MCEGEFAPTRTKSRRSGSTVDYTLQLCQLFTTVQRCCDYHCLPNTDSTHQNSPRYSSHQRKFRKRINPSTRHFVSCGFFTSNSRKTVKIIHLSGGSLQEFETAMKAAEVMVENPQHLECHCSSLQMGRRIAALSADEDLEIGEIYFLIPMTKLNSVLCPSDMASLAAFVADRRKSNDIVKILPLFADSLQEDEPANASRGHFQEPVKAAGFAVPKLQLDDLPEETLAVGKRVLRNCGYYWKPALDTITESPRPLKA